MLKKICLVPTENENYFGSYEICHKQNYLFTSIAIVDNVWPKKTHPRTTNPANGSYLSL